MIQVSLCTNPKLEQKNNLIKILLANLQGQYTHQLTIIDVSRNHFLENNLDHELPNLEIGPISIKDPLDRNEIITALRETKMGLEQAEKKQDLKTIQRLSGEVEFGSGDKLTLWFSRYYLVAFSVLLFFYFGTAMLAPVFMKVNLPGPAKLIYKIYSPFCHQLAYRSFFLFGEQIAYPRELANVHSLITYEKATGLNAYDLETARSFLGNEQLGYKMALCERDIAIYASIFLFGIIFALSRRRIKPLHWIWWIALGVLPIGLDGTYQMVSQMGLPFLTWLPVWESTPFLRVLTGALFGFMTAWYGYPTIEMTVKSARLLVEKKSVIYKAREVMG